MKKKLRPADLRALDRPCLEKLSAPDLVELCVQLRTLAIEQAERLSANSGNSSKPPSSNDPYRRNPLIDGGNRTPGRSPKSADPAVSDSQRRTAGHQVGAPGKWRSSPLVASDNVDHLPPVCASCGQSYPAVMERRCVSAHYVMDLERRADGIGVTCLLHRYFAIGCSCGCETRSAPGCGVSSKIDGRCRNLTLTERCLVGPALATFIAGLSVRYRLSRGLVEEFLHDWLGLDLAKGTICRCIREVGLACEPVADELLTEIRSSQILHLDETPWYQKGAMRWLWVVTNATSAVFHIGTREKAELLELIGESFFGWLVTDGYKAYRSHKKRQRCLAHLIRKAVALHEGIYADAARFGDWIARELRGLIHGVAEDAKGKTLGLIVARLKKACLLNQDACIEKARALAREILNDWDAVIAFVKNSDLPPTNNEAERALRHAVISRRISYGTRTDEGSRGYAATLSVIETCRKRSIIPWKFITDLLAAARRGAERPILAA
jgi:transposase